SLDNYHQMLNPLPEPVAPPGTPRQTPVPPPDALGRIAVALYHWLPSSRELEARLETAGDKDSTARLRIVREEIAEALNTAAIKIVEAQGRPFSEVIDHVTVLGWRQQPGAIGEVVCQVIDPIVFFDGAILRRGKVVMAKAPSDPIEPSAAPKSEP